MKYVLKKLLVVIVTLLIVSFVTFIAFQIIPGDPTTRLLGTQATPEKVAALRAQMGLDQPFFMRYFNWLFSFLKGDMGTSYGYSMPVSQMVMEKLPTTAILTGLSFIITVIISIPMGLLAGSVKNKVIDWILSVINQICMSVPSFFIGIIISVVFGLGLRWFIPGSFVPVTENPWKCIFYLLFPAISVAIPRIAIVVKMLRCSVLNELSKDYIRTAVSRGNTRAMILRKHVLRNAVLPVITFLALSLAEMMAGVIIIETVFTVPGIGRLMLNSIGTRDFPVVQAIVVILAAWIVLVNFIGDLLNQMIDPRLRLK